MSSNFTSLTTSQLLKLNTIFTGADTNSDKYITEDELKNIFSADFASTVTTEDIKTILRGYDQTDEGLLDFNEFNKLFQDIDVDGDTTLGSKEYSIVQKRIGDNKKIAELGEQYKIVYSTNSTTPQKTTARFEISILDQQRTLTKSEIGQIKQSILIDGKNTQIAEKQSQLLSANVSISDTKKLQSSIKTLQSDLVALNATKSVSDAQVGVDTAKLNLLLKTKEYGLTSAPTEPKTPANPPVTVQEFELSKLLVDINIKTSDLTIAQNNLDLLNNTKDTQSKENQLTKFYVLDSVKDKYRNDINKNQGTQNVLNEKINLSQLSKTVSNKALEYYTLLSAQTPAPEATAQKVKEITIAERKAEISYNTIQILEIQNSMNNMAPGTSQSVVDKYNNKIATLTTANDKLYAEILALG